MSDLPVDVLKYPMIGVEVHLCRYLDKRDRGLFCTHYQKYLSDLLEPPSYDFGSNPLLDKKEVPLTFHCPLDAGTERSRTECYYIKEEKKMKNVTINIKVYEVMGEKSLHLQNGCLVVHYNKMGDVLGAFIVTSFRDQKKALVYKESTANYCSLVNLETGYLAFEEHCSRHTTVARVLSHLNPNDWKGKRALESGQYVEVYNREKYNLDINFDPSNKQ